jgi:hypothetical protein
MKVEELISISPELKLAIANNQKLMKYLEEEIASSGSLEAAIYNSLSIRDGVVYDTDGNILATL